MTIKSQANGGFNVFPCVKVPDMVSGSTLNICHQDADPDEGDESEDELEDDVPWRSPSEKIA